VRIIDRLRKLTTTKQGAQMTTEVPPDETPGEGEQTQEIPASELPNAPEQEREEHEGVYDQDAEHEDEDE